MSEFEGHLPTMRLKGEDGEFDVTPENGVLSRHLGERAIFDNIFMVTGLKDDGSREGTPVFLRGFVDDATTAQITHFMITRGYECHLNLPDVMEAFVDVHSKFLARESSDVGDTVPEDWLA